MAGIVVDNALIVSLNDSFGVNPKLQINVAELAPLNPDNSAPDFVVNRKDGYYAVLAQWAKIVVTHTIGILPAIKIDHRKFPANPESSLFSGFDDFVISEIHRSFTQLRDETNILYAAVPEAPSGQQRCPYSSHTQEYTVKEVSDLTGREELREKFLLQTIAGMTDGTKHATMIANAVLEDLTIGRLNLPTPHEYRISLSKAMNQISFVTNLHMLPFLLSDLMIQTKVNPYFINPEGTLCFKKEAAEFIQSIGKIYTLARTNDVAPLEWITPLTGSILAGLSKLNGNKDNINFDTIILFLNEARDAQTLDAEKKYNSVISCPATLALSIKSWSKVTEDLINRWYTANYILTEHRGRPGICSQTEIFEIIELLQNAKTAAEIAEKFNVSPSFINCMQLVFCGNQELQGK